MICHLQHVRVIAFSQLPLTTPYNVLNNYLECHSEVGLSCSTVELTMRSLFKGALLQFPPLQYRKQGHSQTSACPKLFSKGSHAFSTFFSLSAASKITALATCALSHHFQNVYNSLSSTLIYTTSISKFNANSNKKFQTATLNQ